MLAIGNSRALSAGDYGSGCYKVQCMYVYIIPVKCHTFTLITTSGQWPPEFYECLFATKIFRI